MWWVKGSYKEVHYIETSQGLIISCPILRSSSSSYLYMPVFIFYETIVYFIWNLDSYFDWKPFSNSRVARNKKKKVK